MTQVVARPQKSTIVRLFFASRPIRLTFRLLERVAPDLGARWAERIWFTLPPRRAEPRADGTGVGAATPFTLSLDDTTVVGEAWGDGPTVYLVHGWAGHRRQLAAFVAPLVRLGHRVVAFDMPSHGESGPGRFGARSSTIVEFTDALTRVIARHGAARAIVAHSMGATAAAGALCDGLRTDRVVMLAPMANPLWQLREFAKVLELGERTVDHLIARVQRRVGAPMRHFDVPELGRAVKMPPTLIVHDRNDVSTPVSDGAAIAAAWPAARLRVTSGLGHRRILTDPDVVTEVVDFVTVGR